MSKPKFVDLRCVECMAAKKILDEQKALDAGWIRVHMQHVIAWFCSGICVTSFFATCVGKTIAKFNAFKKEDS